MENRSKRGVFELIEDDVHEHNQVKLIKYKLTPKQKEILKKYVNFLISNQYSDVSIKNVVIHLRMFCSIAQKEFKDIKKQDIEKFISKKVEGDLKPQSINTYKQRIKEFFKWFYDKTEKGEYPDIVKWIKIKVEEAREYGKNELISWQDMKDKIIPACNNFRDKAFFSLLRESGARINEVLNTNVGDLRLENDRGFIKLLNSKRRNKIKNYRELVLIDSFFYIDNWLRNHPLQSKDSPLFVSKNLKRMKYDDVSRLIAKLKNTLKKTHPEWKKRLNPHHFRHSQVSDMSKMLTDAELRVFGGWSKTSPMPGRYTHLQSEDINKKIIEKSGRGGEIKMEEKPDLKSCARCNTLMDFNKFEFCGKCGMALGQKVIGEHIDFEKYKENLNIKFKDMIKREEEKIRIKLKKFEQDAYSLKELSQSEDFLNFIKIFKTSGGRTRKELEQLREKYNEVEEGLEQENKLIKDRKWSLKK